MWNFASLRLRTPLVVSLILGGAVAASNCAVEDLGPDSSKAGSAGSGGASGTGGGGAAGSSGAGTSGSGGSGGSTSGGSGGSSAGSGGSAGDAVDSGATGGSAGAATGGSAGSGGAAGSAAGAGGTGGAAAGAGGTGGSAGSDGGVGMPEAGHVEAGSPCAMNKAVSLGSNKGASDPDTAKAHVEVDFAGSSDLPTGNTKRTIEFWAYVLTTSWAADANTMFFYGGDTRTAGTAGGFGLDFGMPGTIDPFTNLAVLDNDNQASGLSPSMNQWAHFAMTWDGTTVRVYVNGGVKASKSATGKTLSTVASVLTIGGYNNAFFNGYMDEFRIWNVDRSAADITATMKTPLVGNETGLTAYYRFDEGTGTTAADSVTSAGHTPHNGTLKAAAAAQLPTWVAGAPLTCP